MKKQLFWSIITCIGCLLILLISACGDDLEDDNNSTDDDGYNYDYGGHSGVPPGTALFERALAEAVGKVPGEEITPAKLATVTHLTVPPPLDGAYGEWIDISLLAHCINLKALNLTGYAVDLSPLAGLPRLEQLNLSGGGIPDFQLLTGLANLQQLDLSWNQVNDLTGLAGMIQLKVLNLHSNNLRDITPLANLIQLKELNLRDNQIHDITPLANLIQIDQLYLDDNMIVDLKPLVDNPGLVDDTREDFDWAGDTVTVSGNPLNDISRNLYIPTLQARGVNVRH